MASPNQLTIQATSGTEAGGLIISGQLRGHVWPDMTDEELVTGIRRFLKESLESKMAGIRTTSINADVRQMVEDGTTDID